MNVKLWIHLGGPNRFYDNNFRNLYLVIWGCRCHGCCFRCKYWVFSLDNSCWTICLALNCTTPEENFKITCANVRLMIRIGSKCKPTFHLAQWNLCYFDGKFLLYIHKFLSKPHRNFLPLHFTSRNILENHLYPIFVVAAKKQNHWNRRFTMQCAVT